MGQKRFTVYLYICLLLESGIDSNAADCTGSTALHILAILSFPDVVQLLPARRGVDMNAVDNHGRTPLAWAFERGSTSVAKLLLKHPGVRLNTQHHGKCHPLWLACRAGESTYGGYSTSARLVAQGNRIDVNSRALGESFTPLLLATSAGREDIVRCLLQHPPIDINAVDASSRTPLSG